MNFNELVTVVLEKDNRSKILKIGLPQEVADYLHELNDKYSLWFADKIFKMPEYQAAKDKRYFVHSLQTSMQTILDWIRGEQNVKINSFDWTTALQKANEYHERLTVTHRDKETNTIIKEYSDGFYWVDIESSSDDCERASMGHCANTNKGETLYSLRKYDEALDKIEGFVTIAISPDDGIWYQCKGKKNSKPKKEYHSYIVDILVDSEVFHFKSEHDSGHDFKAIDFRKFLEDNPEIYPNTDEIIQKLSDKNINVEDFQKIIDEYKYKYYSISLDDDYEGEYISPRYNFDLYIKKTETNLPIDCLELEYKSPAIQYFRNLIEGGIEDISVDRRDDGIIIYINQYSDESYSFDDEGLKSFRRDCEYRKREDEKFDYQEFLDEHLEKILILDDCLITDYTNFHAKVTENLTETFVVIQNPRTLDLEIKLEKFKLFRTDMNVKDGISYRSILPNIRTNNHANQTTVIHSAKEIKNAKSFQMEKHADLLLLSLFWDFIKNQVIVDYSKHMKVQYETLTEHNYFHNRFDLIFNYDYEDNEEIDYEKEYNYLEILDKNLERIDEVLHKFIKEIFNPFINDKIPFTEDDIVIEPRKYTGGASINTKQGEFLGFSYNNEVSSEEKAELIKSKGLDHGYRRKINIAEIEEWLENNVNDQLLLPSFKDFFESLKR